MTTAHIKTELPIAESKKYRCINWKNCTRTDCKSWHPQDERGMGGMCYYLEPYVFGGVYVWNERQP